MSQSGGEHLELQQNQLDLGNDIQKVLSKYKDREGYEDFVKMLEKREDKNGILKVFLDTTKSNYIEEYLLEGFPTTEDKIDDFKNQFSVPSKFAVLDTALQLEGVLQEKDQQVTEKDQQVTEKDQQVIDKTKKTVVEINRFSSSIGGLENNAALRNLPGFTNLVESLKTNLGQLNVDNINELSKEDFEKIREKIKDSSEKIINFLKQGNNLQTVLETARKSGDAETYNSILNSVAFFAQGDPELAQKLNTWNETIKKENKDYNEASVIRQIQTREFFGSNLEGVRSTERGYMLGDKEIDFTTRPPSSFVKSEKGYRLETELPRIPKEYNEKRREWQKRRDVLKKDFEREKNTFDLKEAELKDFVKDFPEPRESWAEEKFQEMKKGLDVIGQNLSTIHESIVALDTEMRQVLSKIEFGDKGERQSKENEKRKTLRFLSSIGFDLVPQSITDSILSMINSTALKGQIDLGGGKRIAGNIDLRNAEFGQDIGQNGEEIFIRLWNKMISGNPEDPLNVGNYVGKDNNPQVDKTLFVENMKKYGVILENGSVSKRMLLENLTKSATEKKEK